MLAVTSAAGFLPSIARAGGLVAPRKSPGDRITIGFIGVGGQGSGLLRGVLGDRGAQVVAVCDVDRDAAQKAAQSIETAYAAGKTSGTFKGCDIYSDFRELLARPDIDAVVIATPDHWHAILTIAAVEAGKDVYVEKPAATSIPESRAMVEAVRRRGAICQVGSMQRASFNFQRAVELARHGLLGKITSVKIGLPGGFGYNGPALNPPLAPQQVPEGFDYNRWLGPAPSVPYYKERCRWNWRWSFDYGGGQLTDWIGHHFDIGAWAIGVSDESPVKISDASAEFVTGNPLFNVATKYAFQAHYAGGQVIQVASSGQGVEGGTRVEGANGWIHSDRGGVKYSSSEIERAAIPSNGFHCTPGGHMSVFLDCVRTRRTPSCPIWEAHHVSSAAHLANAAFRSGRSEVTFDPKSEQIVGAPDADSLLHRIYRDPWILPA